jgi:hypothetical protein
MEEGSEVFGRVVDGSGEEHRGMGPNLLTRELHSHLSSKQRRDRP